VSDELVAELSSAQSTTVLDELVAELAAVQIVELIR
jgi:hypothetical protein